MTARDIGESLIAATYSSRYTSRNFWRDDASGTSYQVQVQVPPIQMNNATDVALIPLTPDADARRHGEIADSPSNPTPPLLMRDVARVMRSEMPGEVDRYNIRRYLSFTANIEGEDLGRVIDRLDAAILRAGEPPKGIEVELRGQVKPMKEMFQSLEIGLAVAVLVILIMLTAYFQASRLAVTAVASVPGVLCGVVLCFISPGRRSTSNRSWGRSWPLEWPCRTRSCSSALATAIAARMECRPIRRSSRQQREAAPILMTACAMTAGMMPMSLGLEEGSEQNCAPRSGRDRRHGSGHFRDAPRFAGCLLAVVAKRFQPIPITGPRRPGKFSLRSNRH